MKRSARILNRCVLETLETRNLLSDSGSGDWTDDSSGWFFDSPGAADTAPATAGDDPTTLTQPDTPVDTQPATQPDTTPDTQPQTQPDTSPTPQELPPIAPWDSTDQQVDSSLPAWDIGISADASADDTTPAPTVSPDAYEYDNQPQFAHAIGTSGQAQYHSIHSPDDVDWVYFDVSTRSQVIAETDGAAGDTEMWLFSAKDLQNAITYNDDGGHGDFSRIARRGNYDLPAGRYYLAIASRDGELIDQYSLRVNVQQQPNDGADPVFDENYYLAHNPDVQQAIYLGQVATGWDHFVLYGQYESRQPSLYYIEAYYRQNNPDVSAAIAQGQFADGWQHFEAYGKREGRQGSPYFNEAAYLAVNPDVAAGVASGQVRSGLDHFMLFGQYEGRNVGNGFDGVYYLANNPDVAAAVAAGQMTAYEHFILYGQFEKRRPGPSYDESAYLARYSDVAAAVADGVFVSGWQHWIEFGIREQRIAV